MFKGRIGGKAQLGYVETDPSGRYGRFRDVLGKGAMKVVYKAFDEILGLEVAWNQIKLDDVFQSPDQLQRLYSEVHLLKNLDHDSIITFHGTWIDIDSRTFNFITELFTSGTLREYRKKYPRVDIRAIKNWARQILNGLVYLHSHDPPVIHRDLKCDNIFVNGHMGKVKIGDLGLAAILRGSQHAHSVIGTPEFMAPELYEEEYNELVDIYSFGMCMIELFTSEFPYSECTNPAQIYKKVTSGKLPEAFYKIQDIEVQKFVGKCLANVSERLSAKELLLDQFLATAQHESPLLSPTSIQKSKSNAIIAKQELSLNDQRKNTFMTITGSMNEEDDTVFLKVKISNKEGHTRNIYFPFDTLKDTPIEVANEMVKELEISDLEPLEIAEMIEEEISSIVPTWRGCDNFKYEKQHSFNYGEEDDNHHPFFSPPSRSSSHGSLPMFCSSFNNHASLCGNHYSLSQDWSQDQHQYMSDDTSSQTSMNSIKCFNFHCNDSCNEDEQGSTLELGEESYCCNLSGLSQLIPSLASLTILERKQLRETYKEVYGEDLINQLQKYDEDDFFSSMKFSTLSLWMICPHDRDAYIAREALQQDETNFKALVEIFVGRKSSHVGLITQAYHKMFRRQLDQDIINLDPPHPFQKILMALSASHKAHQVDISHHISKCDARRLYETGEGSLGAIDEAVVLEILSKRSIQQLKLTFLSYKHIYGHDYTKSIKRGNYGQFGKALMVVVRCICNQAHYYAKGLYTSIKNGKGGIGTLARTLVSRADIDMDEIRSVFKEKYEKELGDVILESIPCGDYRDFLVALATKSSIPSYIS